ncbi:MAG: hypothetical protein ABWZ99_16550 [Ilumatobacteraceae bacterium]
MGQLVGVTEKPSATRGIVRFETNRTISGSGHEQFRTVADAYGDTPSDELARRLFATGQVGGVHVMANIVTVDLVKGHDSSGLADVVRDLYQYWHPGMEPPVFEEGAADDADAGASAGDAGAAAGGDAALSEAAKRVPGHLLERSRAARVRWAAK